MNILLDSAQYEDTQFHEDAWQADKDKFGELATTLTIGYENRYKTNVSYVVLAGRVGLWHGSPIGGKVINCDQNPLDCMGRVDNIDVVLEEDRTITIRGYHHDGTHRMNLYMIPDTLVEKLENKGIWDTPDGYEWIVENRKPIKLPKHNGYYSV